MPSIVLPMMMLMRILAHSNHLMLTYICLIGLLIFNKVILRLALVSDVLRTGVLVRILSALLRRPDSVAHPLSADWVIAESSISDLGLLLLRLLLLLIILWHLLYLRWMLLIASCWIEVVAVRLACHLLAACDLRWLRRAALLNFLYLVSLLVWIMIGHRVALVLPQSNVELHVVDITVAIVKHFL